MPTIEETINTLKDMGFSEVKNEYIIIMAKNLKMLDYTCRLEMIFFSFEKRQNQNDIVVDQLVFEKNRPQEPSWHTIGKDLTSVFLEKYGFIKF